MVLNDKIGAVYDS